MTRFTPAIISVLLHLLIVLAEINGVYAETAQFCNGFSTSSTLYMEVIHQGKQFAMEIDRIGPRSCISYISYSGAQYFVTISDEEVSEGATMKHTASEEVARYVFGEGNDDVHWDVIEEGTTDKASGDGGVEANLSTIAFAVYESPINSGSLNVKRPLQFNERHANIRVKVICYAPHAEVLEEKIDEDTEQPMHSFLMTIKYGEHAYLNVPPDTTAIACERYWDEGGEKLFVFSNLTIAQSGPRIWILVDSRSPLSEEDVTYLQRYNDFSTEYFRRNQRWWLHYFGPQGPRAPPRLHMWSAERLGQLHHVESAESYWKCNPESYGCTRQSSAEPLRLKLEVLATQPKTFLIRNFLSEFECNEIIRQSLPKLQKSQIIASKDNKKMNDNVRNSSTAWVHRLSSTVIDTIYRRAADVLQIDQSVLHAFVNAEELQVVRYLPGEYYRNHLDWGEHGGAPSRYITFLMYLTNQTSDAAGGETAFPLGDGGEGFKVHPGQGSVVMFYNLLEDGNGDEHTLHTALPVVDGVKWLANLWVWDPIFKSDN